MHTTLLGTLPRAVTRLTMAAERAAALTDEGSLWLLERGAVRHVASLDGPVVGLGADAHEVHVVDTLGLRTRLNLATGALSSDHLGPCRGYVLAAGRSARIVPVGGELHPLYRADSVLVWDEHRACSLGVYESPARDCFSIDEVALSPDGELVAWTGLDTYYTSEGDWGGDQFELLGVAEVGDTTLLVDLTIGETWSPSEHRARRVALTSKLCFAGGHLVAIESERAAREALVDDPPHERARWCCALERGLALLDDERLVFLDETGALRDALPLPQARALAAAGPTQVVVALDDGRVLRVG